MCLVYSVCVVCVHSVCVCVCAVLTYTLDAVSQPAVTATALEASRHVDTGGVHVTVMSSDLTLVDVCRAQTTTSTRCVCVRESESVCACVRDTVSVHSECVCVYLCSLCVCVYLCSLCVCV